MDGLFGGYLRTGLMASSAIACMAAATPAMAQTRNFNVPAQDAARGIAAFARQADIQLLISARDARGRRTNEVRGILSVEQALQQLLADTGLRAQATGTQTWSVVPVSGEAQAGGAAADSGSAEGQDIVVVGTNIRGVYPSSSPVTIYDAEAIARTAATTTEQFVERIPQNLGTRSQYAAGRNTVTLGAQNLDSVSGVDLRGLGVGTTLTLLNGRRLGASDSGQSADISLIPIGAIERVEVLTDGASAIYGSDAVGGVVNFVLRRDFNGLETSASYGGVTDGGLRQWSVSQMFGRGWNSGNLLVSYNHHNASALRVADRDFATAAGPGTLTPEDDRHNMFATVTQHLGDRLTVGATGGIAWRDVRNELSNLTSTNALQHTRTSYESSTIQVFGDLAVEYDITDDLNASIRVSYSNVDVGSDNLNVQFNRVPVISTRTLRSTNHGVLDFTAKLDGTLFATRAGDVRFSIGGGRLTEQYEGVTFASSTLRRAVGRATDFAFGEIFVPIIGRSQNVPLVDRLELSIAGRYTSLRDTSDPRIGQDFGDSFDPKIGILWAPFEGLNLRGTYGTAFRAPSLPQLDPTGGLSSIITVPVQGVTATLLALPPAPAANLRPETARTFTLGFDLRPRRFPGFNLSATYYSIEYTDRIGMAPSGINIFANPEQFPDKIYRVTSAAAIEELLRGSSFISTLPGINNADLSAVAAALFARPNLWIFDNRFRNLAVSEQDGLDFSISNRFGTPAGELTLGANVTYILNYRQQATISSPVVVRLDSPLNPVDLRGRAYATFSTRSFSGTLSLNHVDGYVNPAFNNERINSWTTLDLHLSYNFPQTTGLLNGLRLSLSAQNITDEDPPFVRYAVGLQQPSFDTANANPLGRFVVISATKRW